MTDPVANGDRQFDGVIERLVREYAGRVPESVVRAAATEAYQPYRSARVTQFLPVLLDRSVRERLRRVLGHAPRSRSVDGRVDVRRTM